MDANHAPATITISIPSDTRFVSLARTSAATLASELDFTIDEVEDLRVAANELVGMVIEWAEAHGAPTVTLQFDLGDDSVRLAVAAQGSDTSTSDQTVDPLAQQILRSVTDSHALGNGHGWLHKRRSPQ